MKDLVDLEQALRELADRLAALRSRLPEGQGQLPPLAAAAQPELQPLLEQALATLSQKMAKEGVQVLIVGVKRTSEGRTTAWYEHFSDRAVEKLLSPELPRVLEGLASLERIRLLLALQGGLAKSSDLMAKSGLTQGQFYHHLRILEASGLVRRRGRDEYEITVHGVSSLFTLLAAASYILSAPSSVHGKREEEEA